MEDFTHESPEESSQSRYKDDFSSPEGQKVWARVQEEMAQERLASLNAEADQRIAAGEREAAVEREAERRARADKVIGRATLAPDPPEEPWRVVGTRFTAIDPLPMEYLWDPWLPLGVLGLLSGDKGEGKTQIMLDLIARISTGSPWPDGSQNTVGPQNCLIICEEDDPARVTRPRLDACGADLDRVELLEMHQGDDVRSPLFPYDAALVEAYMTQEHVKLLLIDLLFDSLQFDTRENQYQNTRSVAGVVAKIARNTDSIIIGTDHLTKASYNNTKHRAQGSIGLSSRAKVTLFTAPSQQNEGHYVFGVGDMNYAAKPESLAYYIGPTAEGTSRIVWDGVSSEKLTELLGTPPAKAVSNKVGEWIVDKLLPGPKLAKEMVKEAIEEGHSKATLYRQAEKMGVIFKDGYWQLPEIF